jgi:hypothetical protein
MDPDQEQAAWHQLECESQQYNDILANDPGYLLWVERMNQENEREVFSESHSRF